MQADILSREQIRLFFPPATEEKNLAKKTPVRKTRKNMYNLEDDDSSLEAKQGDCEQTSNAEESYELISSLLGL